METDGDYADLLRDLRTLAADLEADALKWRKNEKTLDKAAGWPGSSSARSEAARRSGARAHELEMAAARVRRLL